MRLNGIPGGRASASRRIARGVAGGLVALAAGLGAGWGCGVRVETAVPAADSTLAYASRQPGGLNARITLYKSLSKKTGKMLGEGRTFTLGAKAKVRAAVELEGREASGARDLMFHLVWVGPDQDEIYRKRVDLGPGDTTTTLETSLSVPPDRRDPGEYSLKVYLFRELIAEKRFALVAGTEEAGAGAGSEGASAEEAAAEKKKRARSGE